ncbi:DEP domain-containing protein 5 [Trichinella pseudospiralis]|uniref:DEP domain-containing protein 5 n=1 Tax=Trichinella pseudospiralis TaxID=6337 RepID=A0A0V1EC31_TRIPS|nr:DEP domain-containing protein 5 [Trichinella pseudospiralis]KRZ20168.1 DEP domain-containing protein 5 [Trichinella pseudospiralis]
MEKEKDFSFKNWIVVMNDDRQENANFGKIFKLWYHKRDPKLPEMEFWYSIKDFPELKNGDVVEIYHNDAPLNRLLVQARGGCMEFLCKTGNTVSVDENLASIFHLRNYGDVVVRKVNINSVVLDVLELSVKEQYISNSDYYRLRQVIVNTCVYLNKKIEHCGMRVYVQEMFRFGERVNAGYVNENTRIVLRSSSALVYIMIQMSQEMWEFDNEGDLHAEKCLEGFLPDLFRKWDERNCSHFVSIVLFSRCFYNTEQLKNLPSEVYEGMMQNGNGEYYQDFYHLIMQNEQFDDWRWVLEKVRIGFAQFNSKIIQSNEMKLKLQGNNTTSSTGNILESLNIPLNYFTKFYKNRSFERTGQMILVITPGSGVFHVDNDLVQLTRQRCLGYGTAVDLVCLGEQPYHVVPLFVLNIDKHYEMRMVLNGKVPKELYIAPFWMNVSYYKPAKHALSVCAYKSRLKLRDVPVMPSIRLQPPSFVIHASRGRERGPYDLYDAARLLQKPLDDENEDEELDHEYSQVLIVVDPVSGLKTRTHVPRSHVPMSGRHRWNSSAAQSRRVNASKAENVIDIKDEAVGLNPFIPSKYSIPISAERRRWIHVFPVDSFGCYKQPHHFIRGKSVIYYGRHLELTPEELVDHHAEIVISNGLHIDADSHIGAGLGKQYIWAWGATGEQRWIPELEIGVDWKSLTVPACLPITIDFFPDSEILKANYVVNENTIQIHFGIERRWKNAMYSDGRLALFDEFIAQRLLLGFQIVKIDKAKYRTTLAPVVPSLFRDPPEKQCLLGLGVLYHIVVLRGTLISTITLKPNFFPPRYENVEYTYELLAPDVEGYKTNGTVFCSSCIANIDWANRDHAATLCGCGDEYDLGNNVECLEGRFMLVPFDRPVIETIMKNNSPPYDLFKWSERRTVESNLAMCSLFIRFLEMINRLRRIGNTVHEEVKLARRIDANQFERMAKVASAQISVESSQSPLPSRTVVSATLVHWMMRNVNNVTTVSDAVELCRLLVGRKLLLGVRGKCRSQFYYGFYLYYFDDSNTKWNANAVDPCWLIETRFSNSAVKLLDQEADEVNDSQLNNYRLDVDPNQRSNRQEWCDVLVSPVFCPQRAFEIHIRWLTATGNIVGDLVHGLWRRSFPLGLNLVPVPIEPFLLTDSQDADPFRNPIFVPFNQELIEPLNERLYRKVASQILGRFGFLPFHCYSGQLNRCSAKQFVHCTGGMLAMVSMVKSKQRGLTWTWNAMVGRRYSNYPITGDVSFQDKLLHDLRRLCLAENGDSRLRNIIDLCENQQPSN